MIRPFCRFYPEYKCELARWVTINVTLSLGLIFSAELSTLFFFHFGQSF